MFFFFINVFANAFNILTENCVKNIFNILQKQNDSKPSCFYNWQTFISFKIKVMLSNPTQIIL